MKKLAVVVSMLAFSLVASSALAKPDFGRSRGNEPRSSSRESTTSWTRVKQHDQKHEWAKMPMPPQVRAMLSKRCVKNGTCDMNSWF